MIRAVDDRTIEFDLRFPSGAFIKFMAIDYVKVLPKHLLEQGVDLNLSENIIKHNSGSGPFVLEEYSSGNSYFVNRNENYFKAGKPYFDRIEHFIIVDTATLTAQIEGRNIDMMNGGFSNLTPLEYLELEQRMEGEYVMHEFPPSGNWGFMMNVKREPFTDPRVRKAIHLAVDRDDLNEENMGRHRRHRLPAGRHGTLLRRVLHLARHPSQGQPGRPGRPGGSQAADGPKPDTPTVLRSCTPPDRWPAIPSSAR